MRVSFEWAGQNWRCDLTAPIDISTRLAFDGPQPRAFGIDAARAEPYRVGTWVGDVREGGSVNCFVVSLCPHGNGTHTECVGHITAERVAVADILEDVLFPASVVSVPLVELGQSNERYTAPHAESDLVVTRHELIGALGEAPHLPGLIIRTLPNSATKRHADWSGRNPPYLTNDAMQLVRELDVKHLLVDFPSVDREEDDGILCNHRTFWDVAPGSVEFENVPSPRTITEMVFVPNEVSDGDYVAAIQIPDFVLDAAPSRVRLFRRR